MKNYQALSAILGRGWLIEPNFAYNSLPLVLSMLDGKDVSFQRSYASENSDESDRGEEPQAKVFCIAAGTYKASRYRGFDEAPEGSIAVLKVSGPIMKYDDGCGGVGTASLSEIVKSAKSSSKISGLIQLIDTPGGMVDGTPGYADAVKEFKAQKPVISFLDNGMMASAGYWFGSAADQIIASQPTDMIGSIGVYSTLYDVIGYYEQKGIKIHEIYAPQSTEKNKDYKDALKGDYAAVKADLQFIADRFIQEVKSNREGKINLSAGDPFKGGLYNVIQGKEIGLLDEIAPFEQAVERMHDLIRERSSKSATSGEQASARESISITTSSTPNTSDMKVNIKSGFKAFLAFFGMSVAAGAETAEFDASEENISRINDALAERETLTASNTDLTSKLSTATADLAARDARIQQLEATIATYGKKPGDDTSSPAATKTDELGGGKSSSVIDEEADYNQNAMRILNR